jgi:hypothetical protein
MMTFVEKESSCNSLKTTNTINTNTSVNTSNQINFNNNITFNTSYEKSPIDPAHNFSIQSTFTFSKNNSLIDSPHNKSNNNVNIYDLDCVDNKNFTQGYSKEIDSEFYPNNDFNYDIMNVDRDIRVDDPIYGSFPMWNLEDYFTI